MFFAGIDAGSRAIKAVLIDNDNNIISSELTDQGILQSELADSLLKSVATKAGISREMISFTVATGYGRSVINFANSTVTEITCHACGVYFLEPDAKTVIDIGGQDSKLIRMDQGGIVRDFVMNDRCAAGTGRFLEVVSQRLNVPLERVGEWAKKASKPSTISSMCVVFAETEIIGLLAAQEPPENIIAGVQHSIATRTASMAGKKIDEPVIFTGGVALISGMKNAMENALKLPVKIAANPQFTGAIGAALLAKKMFKK